MPVPQFFYVEQASCLFQNLIKRTVARGLLSTENPEAFNRNDQLFWQAVNSQQSTVNSQQSTVK